MNFRLTTLSAAALALLAAGCGGSDDPDAVINVLPAGFTEHGMQQYGATAPGAGTTAASQDLLTAGLGKTGLGAAAAPAYADPLNPTAQEQRAAICRFHAPRLVLHRASERAAGVTKQLRRQQVLTERGTVDGDERTIGAAASRVDGARQHALAGAALTAQEHRRI